MPALTHTLPGPESSILLVCHRPPDLPDLETALGGPGRRLARAHSAAEALARLAEDVFAVVVLDLQTPGLDGIQAARQIRAREGARRTPILFLLAPDGGGFPLAQAYALGAVDHLARPIVREVLQAKVQDVTERHRAEQANAGYLERLRILHQIDRALIAGESPAAIAAAALVPLRQLLGIPRAIVNLFDLAKGEVEWLAAAGRKRVRAGPGVRYSIRLMGDLEALRRGELQSIDVHALPPGPEADALLASGVHAYAVVPMIAAGELIGALSLGGEVLPASAEQLAVAREVAAQFAVALAQARLHEQIKSQAQELMVRVAERERAEAALRETGRRKDAFLAMLAHELRTPLATLAPAVEALRRGGSDPRVRGQSLERMERQLGHLRRLVDDLLDASRFAHGKVRLAAERLDLARLARAAAEDGRAALAESGLSLELLVPETPVWVCGDPVRLVQTVNNLLDNAARYSDPGGRVTLAVTAEATAEQALLTVQDTGVGIAPEVLPRLFRPFEQADQGPDRRRGGLGLGLSVVRALAELHGGAAEAHSDGPGFGATFTVRPPLVQELGALAEVHEVAPPDGGGRHRILVVEDNSDAAGSLQILLEVLGHEVRVAATGPDGVRAAAEWLPEVVLSDVGLPGFDGWEVARRVRRLAGMEGALLVALTGYGGEDDRRRSHEAGFHHHLVKPAEPADLRRVLATRTA